MTERSAKQAEKDATTRTLDSMNKTNLALLLRIEELERKVDGLMAALERFGASG